MSDTESSARAYAFDFVAKLNDVILEPTVLLLMAVALLVFLYGGLQYILYADSEQARSDGQKHMLYGIIGFLVMVSALAILQIFATTLGLDGALDGAMSR